jgi:ParB-like chromosome segregation protein Spo0J
MIVRTAKLTELHADPSNARSHDERNLSAISDSLKAFGQVEPLVVQKSSGKVIGGNGRLEVMRRQGVTECSIVEVDISDSQAVALGIALNRTGELAAWNDETLAKLLESLPDDVFAATGFSDSDLKDLLDKLAPVEVTEDEVPEPPEIAVTQPGDLWVLGEHALLCLSPVQRSSVMRTGAIPPDTFAV